MRISEQLAMKVIAGMARSYRLLDFTIAWNHAL